MSEPLIEAAQSARSRAYAPYSGYAVGCAIETDSGGVFVGTNIENVSFGATLCAERVAVGSMVSAGRRTIRRVAISTRDGSPPCGICLQVLSEFASSDMEILTINDESVIVRYTLGDLLPHGFASGAVKRTERA